MINGLFDGGGLPVLERLVQFTEARHSVLADNIANLSTPYYKPRDLDPRAFQANLRQALDRRRSSVRPMNGPLHLNDTRQLRFQHDGIRATPAELGDNVLFHDENNRDVERLMQRLAENTMAHNMAIEMMRNQLNLLGIAIRERV